MRSFLITCGFVGSIAIGLASMAAGQDAPISVILRGHVITVKDIRALAKGVLAAKTTQAVKAPQEMPREAPLAYYAGRGVIWESKLLDQNLGDWSRVPAQAQPGEDAFVAAAALAAMDAGTAGDPWDAIYREAPADRASRVALGKAVADALKEASDQSAAFGAAQTAWIQSHLIVGLSRSDVYEMLRARGLVAFNNAYAQSRSIGDSACLPPDDPTSGRWPYENEPLPKLTGLCAKLNGDTKPVPNPNAFVKVSGAFGLGCWETIQTTISFDLQDRVSKIAVAKPDDECV